MPCFHMRLYFPYLPLNRAPNILPFSLNDCAVEHTHSQSNTVLSFSTASSCQKLHRIKAFQINFDVGDISAFAIDSCEEVHGDGCGDYQDLYGKDSTEIQRRENTGQWTKGNVPWNKGMAHSEETRKCISERTREALRNLKDKKKTREHPRRPHSDERKAKISASQRKVWAKRLNVKHQKQKFFHSWGDAIAETAKKGGSGEEELGWDSYNEILHEMDLLEIEEERNAKEISKEDEKMKDRMKVLARKRIEREERVKTRVKKPRRPNESASAQGKKLRQNLRKIRKGKGINGRAQCEVSAMVPHIPALEKIDIEHIKKEKVRNEVSLADQLRAARNKRSENAATDASGQTLDEKR